jgi:hypothetical protein
MAEPTGAREGRVVGAHANGKRVKVVAEAGAMPFWATMSPDEKCGDTMKRLMDARGYTGEPVVIYDGAAIPDDESIWDFVDDRATICVLGITKGQGEKPNASEAFGRAALSAWTRDQIEYEDNIGNSVRILLNCLMLEAGARGNVEFLEAAQAIGGYLDEQDQTTGRTALILAAWLGQVEAARYLIKNGARVDLADTWGNTPLHSAAENGHPEIVRLLLEAGADPTKRTTGGWTPNKTPLDLALAKRNQVVGNDNDLARRLDDVIALLRRVP